jgi:type III secretory pathway component EscR
MESNLNEFDQEPLLRPTLLTVLCILTFIGSGLTMVKNAYSYSMAAKSAKIFSSSVVKRYDDSKMQKDSAMKTGRKNRSIFGEKMIGSLSKIMTEDNIRKSAIGEIISGLCTLLGALLMWRLRRNGFYLYIAGVVIGLVVPFWLYGNNLMAVGISSFSSFFGLVFIALYALNIKSLR